MGELVELAVSIVFGLGRLISFRPKITKQGNTLVATSDWRGQLLCLGAFARKVVVDPARRIVRIRYRRFWFFTATRWIEFPWIGEVTYGYADMAPESVLPMSAYRSEDMFTVGLQLHNGEDVALFRFFGQGPFVNNTLYPDWWYWEGMFQSSLIQGDQETDSLMFAEILSQLIGVPIGHPAP